MLQRPDWTTPQYTNLDINLSTNVCWDTILHEQIKHMLFDCSSLLDYPNPYPVYHAISTYYDLNISELALGLGSEDVINRIIRVLNPKTVYIVSPTWGMVEPICIINGVSFIPISYQQACHYTNQEATLYLANPNGLTGEVVDVRLFSQYKYVILDEAYGDWASEYSHLYKRPKNVIITKTLSKSLAIPGFRVGFAYGYEPIIDKIQTIRPMCVTTRMAEIIVPQIMHYTNAHIDRMLEAKKKLENVFDCIPTHGNFVRFKEENILTKTFGCREVDDSYRMSLADWSTLSNVITQ